MDTEPAADYPQLFRQMIVRSTEAALRAIDPQAPKLEEEERERSLYALGLALDLPEAWPVAGDLTLTLAPYVEMQGFGVDWVACLERAAAQATEQQDLRSLARLHLQIGRVHGILDEHAVAEQHLWEGHRIAVEIDDADVQARALHRLAQTAAEAGDFQRAKSLVEQVLPIVPEFSPVKGYCHAILGLAAMRQGDWDLAIQWYQHSLRIVTAAGEPRFAAQAERTLGLAYRYSKQYEKAIVHFKRSLEATAVLSSSQEYAIAQMEIGVTHWYLGQHEEALHLYSECEPTFVAGGSKVLLGHLYNNRGLALRDLDRTNEAQDSFFASIQIMRELHLPLWVANVLESLGGLYQRMGKSAEAVVTWQQALQELNALPEMPGYLHDLLVRRIQEVKDSGEPSAGFP
jgi:tetratricopeptide (TPR) repeat protein